MANRQSRDPGTFRNIQSRAQIGGVPSFAVDTGDAFRALARVGTTLSGQLDPLIKKAAVREGELAGLSAGERGAVSYLQARNAEQAAPTQGKRRPSRGQVNASPVIRNMIVAAAQKYGQDPAALLKIAQLESTFNPGAKNPDSSAGGLFQFIDSTASQYGLADRFDPAQASDAGARLLRDNRAHLVKALGREPGIGELYLAHQQGAGGAAKLLSNPNAKAVDIVGEKAVRLNGGKTSMTAAEFAGLWLTKAGDEPGKVQHGLPTLNTRPLALRNDGTISGEAYDRSARSAYFWRLSEGLITDLGNAYDDFGDDPAAFGDRVEEIRARYLQDPNLQDPELREKFLQTFERQTRAYRTNVASRMETRQAQEEKAAANGALDARERDMERQAFALGANPAGDQILADQIGTAHNQIDAAVEAGTISAAAGVQRKEQVILKAVRGRVRGTFEALDTPAQKEQFALSLLEDWQKGEGPLSELGYDQVKALSQSLYRDARALANQQDAEARIQKAKLKDLLADDIASIEATGQPIDLEAEGFAEDMVIAALSPTEFADWQEKRDRAGSLYDAVSDLETLPAEEIEKRLEGPEPEPGQPGFGNQQAVLNAAERRARTVLEERANDPARAVD